MSANHELQLACLQGFYAVLDDILEITRADADSYVGGVHFKEQLDHGRDEWRDRVRSIEGRLEQAKHELLKSGYDTPDHWLAVKAPGVKEVEEDPFIHLSASAEDPDVVTAAMEVNARIMRWNALGPGDVPQAAAGEPRSESVHPTWNRELGELRLGDRIIKKVKNLGSAKNVVCVLDAFERHGWKRVIPDPFRESKHKSPDYIKPDTQLLKDTVSSLNRNLSAIRFGQNGDGTGLCWRFSDE